MAESWGIAVMAGIRGRGEHEHPESRLGEELTHINTQLFSIIDPPGNRAVMSEQMTAPNAPGDPHATPTMDGFVADYISMFTAEMGRQPAYEEYAQIMTGYTPEQVPVVSAIARAFATFDHWHCDVPSQTFTNRSFYHAATSSGFVVNAPYDNFPPPQRCRDHFRAAGNRGPVVAGLRRPRDAFLGYRDDLRLPAVPVFRHPLLHPGRLLRRRRARHPARLLVHRAVPGARPQRLPSGRRRGVRRSGGQPAVLDPGRGGTAGPPVYGGARILNRRRLQFRQHAVPGRVRRTRRHL